MLSSTLFDMAKLTKFRKDLHKFPELGYEEVETSRKIIEYLNELGIEKFQISRVAKTGIIADIYGKAPPSGRPFTVALRADMDCLPMKELSDLEHKSAREDRAHMCGHDGHCAWVLGAASKILEKINLIPSDKRVRLLFQPAEEVFGGAFPMIQEGCLIDVDEAYGAHNTPAMRTGYIGIKGGPILAEITSITVKLIGKGGHGSAPENAKDPLQAAVDIILGHQAILQSFEELVNKKMLVSVLPYLHCGEVSNVIADHAIIQGDLRTFDENATFKFKAMFNEMCQKVCLSHGMKCEVVQDTSYPVVINTPKQTQIVEMLAKEIYGEDNVVSKGLPSLGAEDFGFFTRVVPGAFFFATSGKLESGNPNLHSPYFDFDDEAIERVSELFFKIVLHRFDLNVQ